MISFNWRRVASTLFGLLLFASSARAVSNYTLIDLGLPPGAVDVSVEAVNTNGIVVGNILMSGGLPRGFVYQNGSITLLTLPSGADRSVARGINGAGQVVGTATFGSDSRAILWTGGSPTIIIGMTEALGINDVGQIVGVRRDATTSFQRRAVLVSGGNAINLGIPVGAPPGDAGGQSDSLAYAINSAGQIAGTGANVGDLRTPDAPWSYVNGSMQWIPRPAGYDRGIATSIAANGTITGYLSPLQGPSSGLPSRGFIYSGGQVTLLPPASGDVESAAFGINAAGDIVGSSIHVPSGARASLFSGGTVHLLSSLVPSFSSSGFAALTLAKSINDRGQIAGHGRNAAGQGRAFLATPIQKIVQTISFPPIPAKAFGDPAFAATATVSTNRTFVYSVVSGPASVSKNMITLTDAGAVTLAASQPGDDAYEFASVQQTFSVAAQTVSITLSDMSKPFNGFPQGPRVTSNPSVVVAVEVQGFMPVMGGSIPGSSRAIYSHYPVRLGTYTVQATPFSANYSGSATGTFRIVPGQVGVTLGNLQRSSAAGREPVTVTTSPAEVMTLGDNPENPQLVRVATEVTYNGSAEVPSAPGSYQVVARVTTYGYEGTATGTLIISAPAPTTFASTSPAPTSTPVPTTIPASTPAPVVTSPTVVNLPAPTPTVSPTPIATPAPSTAPSSSVIPPTIVTSAPTTSAPTPATQTIAEVSLVTTAPVLSPTGPEQTAGTYFGLDGNVAFGMLVRPDRSAVLLARVGASQQVLVGRFQVAADGGFSSATTDVRDVRTSGPVFAGRISNGQLTASLDSTVTISARAGALPVGLRDGFYQAGALGTTRGSLYVISTGENRSLVIVRRESGVETTLATLRADGSFSAVLSDGTLTGTIDVTTGGLTATGTFGGRAIGFEGMADSLSRAPRFANIATRGQAGVDDAALIAGFVIDGTSPRQVLVRAAGPGLRQFGIGDTLSTLRLSVRQGERVIAENAGWSRASDRSAIVAAAVATGAFAFAEGSADAAILVTLPAGAYTAVVMSGEGQAAGALVEIYDVSEQSGRVVNLSTRGEVAAGNSLIAGIVVGGNMPKPMLVRAIGPGLQTFGVGNALARPELTIFQGETAIATATGVSHAATEAQAALEAGAFALPAGSLDAVIVITVAPGAYTAVVTGAGGARGSVLVEAYELP